MQNIEAFYFGGLGQNRTADTRIFNTCGDQMSNVYAAYNRIACHVLQTVLQKNHTIWLVNGDTF